ncbi:MAG TPA: dihydrolipoamide acetyltransferase family protein [Pseudonocardiaceae bacterium]|nr:dihydrolipoamide acetyltransferase family protein [Pseudonocardiaceae bacterium]
MPELLRMPEIAANTEEATLASWPVPERQPFRTADVIATVETAKAAVDVAAEADGVIIRMLVEPGTDVRVGDAIALLAAPDEQVDDVDAVLARLGVGAAAAAPVVAAPAVVVAEPVATNGNRVFASPLARRIAKEHGLDYETLTGSGPNGRITRRDVEAVLAQQPAVVAPATPSPPPTPVAGSHSRMRRAIAQRLTESKQTIPHFYLRGTARVDKLLALRAELNAVSPTKISVNDLVLKAVAIAHSEVDGVNAIWTDDGMRRFDSVDLGVAVATDDGLLTPVVRDVRRLSVGAVASATRELAERARTGGLRQAELEGGATTITNLGMYGTEEFAAIINPPQSSILAVGAARKEPVVNEEGELSVATVLRVTLSVDHRAIDGALAAQWMRVFLAVLEQPLRILA